MVDRYETYRSRMKEFCRTSVELYRANNEKVKQSQNLENLSRSCWEMRNEKVYMMTSHPKTKELVRFAYNRVSMDWNPSKADNWRSLAEWIRGYSTAVYFNQYFLFCIKKAKLLEILEEDLSAEDCLEFLESTLQILQQPPVPLSLDVINYLKEMCLYFLSKVHGFISEVNIIDEKPTNRLRIWKDIINLFKQYSAFGFLSCAFTPNHDDIRYGKLLIYVLNLQIHPDQKILLLQQFPIQSFVDAKPSLSVVRDQIVNPIRQKFPHLTYYQDGKLIFQFCYMFQLCSRAYPDITLEAFSIIINGKFPMKVVMATVLPAFQWKGIQIDAVKKCFYEMFNLYNQDFSSLSPDERSQHQMQFVNGFLIQNLNVINHCYHEHPFIRSSTHGLQFPILKFFSHIGMEVANQDVSFFQDIVRLLFDFAFRTGTTNSNNLRFLLTLRNESCGEIKRMCSKKSRGITVVLKLTYDLLHFLLSTQPTAISYFNQLIQEIDYENYILSGEDAKIIQELLFNFSQQKSTFQSIVTILLVRVNWKKQTNVIRTQLLEDLLLFSAQSGDCREWVIKFLQSMAGNAICEINDIDVAENFLKRIKSQSGDVIEIVRILISLTICAKKSVGQGETDSELLLEFEDHQDSHQSTLDSWKYWENVYNVQNSINELLKRDGSPKLIHATIKKYVQYFSHCNGKDIDSRIFKLFASVISKDETIWYDTKQHLSDLDSLEFQAWMIILVHNLSVNGTAEFLNNLVKDRYKGNLSLNEIANAMKSLCLQSHQIVNFLDSQQIWLAYTAILSMQRKIPAMEANDSYSGLHEVVSSFMSTETPCGMWIASDCAQRLINSHHRVQSLLFWELFFRYYHEAINQYGSHTFPSYLKRRYEKQFQLCAYYFQHTKEEQVYDVFLQLENWNYSDLRSSIKAFDFEGKVEKQVQIEYGGMLQQSPIANQITGPSHSLQIQSMNPEHDLHSDNKSHFDNRGYPNQNRYPNVESQSSQYHYANHGNQQLHSNPEGSALHLSHNSTPNINNFGTHTMQSSLQSFNNVNSENAVQGPVFEYNGKTLASQQSVQKLGGWEVFNVATSNLYNRPQLFPIGKPHEIPKDVLKYDIPKLQFLELVQENTVAGPSDFLQDFPSLNLHDVPKENDFSDDMISIFNAYKSLFEQWKDVDDNYVESLSQAYINVPKKERFSFFVPFGGNFITEMDSSLVTKSEEAIQAIDDNRKQASDVEKRIHQTIDKLSVVCIVLSRINKILTTRKVVPTSVQEIYLSILKLMLNMKDAKYLNHIWIEFSEQVQTMGKSICHCIEMQEKVLNVIMEAPALPVETQNDTSSVKSIDRVKLFNGFNPSILLGLDTDLYVNIIDKVSSAHCCLSPVELNHLLQRLSIDQLILTLVQREPGTRFDIDQLDSKRIIDILKNSLSSNHLKQFGLNLLASCLELAYPLEYNSFLEMILSLAKSRMYKEDDWHPYFANDVFLKQTSYDQIKSWIVMLEKYASNPCGKKSMILFVEKLVLASSFSTALKRTETYSDPINCVLTFYKSMLYNEQDVACTLSIDVFNLLMQSIHRIVKQMPTMIERLWDLYYHVLSNYSQDIRRTGHADAEHYFQILSSTMQLVDWSMATFHESYSQILDEMWQMFPLDPFVISSMFNSLNWNHLTSSSNSKSICLFVRLYMDVSVFTETSTDITKLVETLDYSKDAFWVHIAPNDFISTFSGSLTRSTKACVWIKDPSEKLHRNAVWLYDVSTMMNNQQVCETISNEIISLMFLVVKNRHTSINWHLPPKFQNQLLQKCLIPLAGSFMSKTLIIQVYSTIGTFENGQSPVVTDVSIPFYNSSDPCPWDNSVDGHKNTALYIDTLKRFLSIFQLYCHDAGEEFCRNSMKYLLKIKNMSNFPKVIILEDLCHAFLLHVDVENPRYEASCAIAFPSDMNIHSNSYRSLISSCCDSQCPILLSILINKGLEMAIRDGTQKVDSDITDIYIYAVDLCLQCMPHRNKNFDLIYLYLYLIEVFESEYWDMSNKAVQEYTEKFRVILQWFASVHVKDWKSLFKKKHPSIDQDLEITPQMSLGCLTILIYLDKVLFLKDCEGTKHNRLLSGTNDETFKSKNFDKLLKLKVKPKFQVYGEFWNSIHSLIETSLSMTEFRAIVGSLFPLVPYIVRI